jgi:alpha-1,2-mannosyltransferase
VPDVEVVSAPAQARGSGAPIWLAAGYTSLAAATAVLIFLRPVTDRLADLGVYWGAAQAVRGGEPLYGFHAANGDPFTYPAFAMVLFYPLAYLPQAAVGVVWTLATFVAVVGLAQVLVTRWPAARPGSGRALVWACAIALLLSAPGQSNVRFGQVSVFIVLVTLADAVGAVPERMRGVLTGAAAAVKLTPLLFIVFYLVTGRRRDAARAGMAFAACTALAWLLLPQASITYWTSALFATSRIGDLAALGNQSVNGMLLRAGLLPPLRPVVWLLLVAVLVGIALWRGRQLNRNGLPVHAAVLVGCATVAASPVSWTHH